MTLETPVATAAAAPSSANAARFPDFGALRKAHLDLKDSLSARSPGAGTADAIRGFLATARRTGAVLMDPSLRKAAQGILDYWSAELAGQPNARSEDFVPSMLEQPDIATLPDIPATADSVQPTPSRDDQRTLIRLSGIARQWRNSGRLPGYLLIGTALAQAHEFVGQDVDLDEFVAASEQAIEKRKRFLRYLSVGSLAFVFLVSGVVFTLVTVGYFTSQLSSIFTQYAASPDKDNADPPRALRWLDRLQPIMPPYDLSGASRLQNVSIPGLRLYAPNFSAVELVQVSFPRATLPAASFSGSSFSFGGGGNNDFSGAMLRLAQFRNTQIAFTSFAGADLYRAVFDRAVLCEVDFTDANLRSASFWSVKADDKTKASLRNTAWWQASGWQWDTIDELARHTPEQDVARTQRLERTSGYKDDIARPIALLQNRLLSSMDRALALNDFAWSNAVWGIKVVAPAQDSDPCIGDGVPANARQASEQAVCIVDKLNSSGEKRGSYTEVLSSLRDTLAYILMQNKDMAAALKVFDQIGKDDAKTLESPETSFRYAIAQYAGGRNKAAAVKMLKTAVSTGGYQPTHELHTLRDDIFPNDDLEAPLKESANRLWPAVANQTECPVRTSSGAR